MAHRDPSRIGTVVEVTGRPVLGEMHEARVPSGDWETLDACPLCGGREAVLDVGIVEGREPGPVMAVCLACEHGFLRRRPSAAWFDGFYTRAWDAAGQRRPAKPRPDPRALDFCREHLAPGAAVLDAGAGFGRALVAFRDAGFEVHALEQSEHRAGFLREVLDIPCENVSVERATAARGFDLVVLQHVMEHVRDPLQALAAARALLAPGGLVYVGVPNFWAEPAPQSFHYVGHCSLFTERSLRALLVRSGFTVAELDVADELQVLGRAADDTQDLPPAAADGAFGRHVAEWVAAAFGPGMAQRAVAWGHVRTRKGGYTGYRVERVPGRLSPALIRAAYNGRGDRARPAGRRARALQRLARTDVSRRGFRMLPVRVAGDGLPVTVRHDTDVPPVWVK